MAVEELLAQNCAGIARAPNERGAAAADAPRVAAEQQRGGAGEGDRERLLRRAHVQVVRQPQRAARRRRPEQQHRPQQFACRGGEDRPDARRERHVVGEARLGDRLRRRGGAGLDHLGAVVVVRRHHVDEAVRRERRRLVGVGGGAVGGVLVLAQFLRDEAGEHSHILVGDGRRSGARGLFGRGAAAITERESAEDVEADGDGDDHRYRNLAGAPHAAAAQAEIGAARLRSAACKRRGRTHADCAKQLANLRPSPTPLIETDRRGDDLVWRTWTTRSTEALARNAAPPHPAAPMPRLDGAS